jgi:sugar lactone lactonase YvrE
MFRTRLFVSLVFSWCVLMPALAGSGCSSSSSGGTSGPPRTAFVFNGENEDLNVYLASDPSKKQVLVRGGETEKIPGPSSLNGQICFDPTNPRQFVMADDNLNPNPPNHFSVFQITGSAIGEFAVNKIANLTPTYQKATSGFGCHFRKDGTLLTSDQGNQDSSDGNGQLVLWFPPFDAANQHYCKLDITIATPGMVYVDEQDRLYIASARLEPGIYRYTGPFPTGDDAAHGCTGTDSTGAPLQVANRERFIIGDEGLPTPTGIARSPQGTFYVTSVLNGVIAEYDQNGKFLRKVLQPPAGEILAEGPYSTGTPYGLEVDSQGTIYYADIGLTLQSSVGSVDVSNGLGSVRAIRFVNGQPQAPETFEEALSFPDGIGVLEL